MRIQSGELIPLGHGTWVRSDEVVAIHPIREKRGPGRRALVWVRGVPEPMVASRSEEAILRDLTMRHGAVDRAQALESALAELVDTVDRVPPVLLRIIDEEAGLDLPATSAQARDALRNGASRKRLAGPAN